MTGAGVAAVAAVAALVHPAGRSFFRSFTLSRVSRPMLALVAVAAVPLIGYASTNLRLQRSVADGHGMMGHYGFMAAVAFTVIAVGVLASLRADGWRLPAWVAGLLPAVVGLASILVPDGASSLDPLWALAGIAWGVAFTGAAEFTNAMKAPKGPEAACTTTPRRSTARPRGRWSPEPWTQAAESGVRASGVSVCFAA